MLHYVVCICRNATLAVNNIGVIEINEERRLKLMKNHSALNLLKAAVRENVRVTGEKYSMVTPTKLRFGFMVYKDKVHVDGMQIELFILSFYYILPSKIFKNFYLSQKILFIVIRAKILAFTQFFKNEKQNALKFF